MCSNSKFDLGKKSKVSRKLNSSSISHSHLCQSTVDYVSTHKKWNVIIFRAPVMMFLLLHSWKLNLKSISLPLLVLSLNTSSVKAMLMEHNYCKTISLATEGCSKYDRPASESNVSSATSTAMEQNYCQTMTSSTEDFSEYNVTPTDLPMEVDNEVTIHSTNDLAKVSSHNSTISADDLSIIVSAWSWSEKAVTF